MRGVFDERESQEAEARHVPEVTLGSTTLLLLLLGLVLVCGLCFGIGYAVGRHGTQDTAAAVQSTGSETTASSDSGRLKPSANTQAGAVDAQPSVPADEAAATDLNATNPTVPSTVVPAAIGSSIGSDGAKGAGLPAQVKPALGDAANVPKAAVLPASPASQATAAPGTVMVQIAAVSQQEDADVLMGALRKRGYEVASRREPLDGMIHVRIGPFKNKDEAEKWRQRLLNDGYNAIIQP
jgi:DedD protein